MKNHNKYGNLPPPQRRKYEFNYDNEAGFSPEDSHLNPAEYPILSKQSIYRGDNTAYTPHIDEIATRYITNTSGLIAVMDGTAEKPFLSDNIIRENEDEVKSLNSFEKPPKPDHVLFLDKSARPVSWLIKDFWQDFADSKTKRPPFSYLNIDRVNFFNMVGLKADSDGKNIETKEVFQPYHFDQQIKNNSPEVLESLRQIKVAIRSQYIDEKMIDPDGDIEE